MMSYNSATGDINRLAKSKNLTMFYEELANNSLPQWIWITPNSKQFLDTILTFLGQDICYIQSLPRSSLLGYRF